jgi:hypothetical protein
MHIIPPSTPTPDIISVPAITLVTEIEAEPVDDKTNVPPPIEVPIPNPIPSEARETIPPQAKPTPIPIIPKIKVLAT